MSRPVTVAHLVNCLGLGGTERQLVELMRRLDRDRWTPQLLCLQKKGEFLEPLRALQLDPEEFHLRGTLLRPNTAVQVARMALRLHESAATLLHCHDFYSNIVGTMAARLAGIPYIVSRRDMGVWAGPGRMRLLALATRTAPRVLCNAAAVRDHVVRTEGLDPARVRVVYNGLDVERFDQDAARPLSPPLPALDGRAPVVTLVGNMKHAVKGHAEFLLAAAAVLRALPATRFLLVGDGELRPEFERRARELGIAHSVFFAGRRTDVPAVLARSTIAVSASRAEGLSNAIMEAMAARLPLVATGVGGNTELVRDGRTGFIVRPGDPSLLAARLVDLLRAPYLALRLGQAGRRRIEEQFQAAHLGARAGTLYEELLGVAREVRRAA